MPKDKSAGSDSISHSMAAEMLGLTTEEVADLVRDGHLRAAGKSGRDARRVWRDQVEAMARMGAAEIRRRWLPWNLDK